MKIKLNVGLNDMSFRPSKKSKKSYDRNRSRKRKKCNKKYVKGGRNNTFDNNNEYDDDKKEKNFVFECYNELDGYEYSFIFSENEWNDRENNNIIETNLIDKNLKFFNKHDIESLNTEVCYELENFGINNDDDERSDNLICSNVNSETISTFISPMDNSYTVDILKKIDIHDSNHSNEIENNDIPSFRLPLSPFSSNIELASFPTVRTSSPYFVSSLSPSICSPFISSFSSHSPGFPHPHSMNKVELNAATNDFSVVTQLPSFSSPICSNDLHFPSCDVVERYQYKNTLQTGFKNNKNKMRNWILFFSKICYLIY
jgi:hypothetical protein